MHLSNIKLLSGDLTDTLALVLTYCTTKTYFALNRLHEKVFWHKHIFWFSREGLSIMTIPISKIGSYIKKGGKMRWMTPLFIAHSYYKLISPKASIALSNEFDNIRQQPIGSFCIYSDDYVSVNILDSHIKPICSAS